MSHELDSPAEDPGPPDVATYLRALRRALPLVVAAVLLAVCSAYFLSDRVLQRTYESSALLIIIPNQASDDAVRAHPGLNAFLPDQSISETFRQLGGAVPVAAAASADLDVPADRLRAQVSTHWVQKTPLLRLSVRAEDPQEAARIAQGYATAFVRTASSLDWVPGAQLQLASPAAADGVLVGPRTLLNAAVAGVVALLLALAAVGAAARFGHLGRTARPGASRRPPAPCARSGHGKGTGRAA